MRMAEFKTGDYSTDSRIESLAEMGNFGQNNCTLTTFIKIDRWRSPPDAYEQLSILPQYVEYCMEKQFLACRDEISRDIRNTRRRWRTIDEENINNLLRLLDHENVDPMQPLGIQMVKFGKVLAAYYQTERDESTSGENFFRHQLFQLKYDCRDILFYFKDQLMIYNFIFHHERIARLIDQPALEMILKLSRVDEVSRVVDKIIVYSHQVRTLE